MENRTVLLGRKKKKSLISMPCQVCEGEGTISHDASVSLSDGMEVNPKRFVAANKLYPRIPAEITYVNTYTLTLIAFEIC